MKDVSETFVSNCDFIIMYCDSDDLGSDLLNHTIKDEKKISPFEPEPVKIDDKAVHNLDKAQNENYRFGHLCVASIFLILYASIFIARRITKKGITLDSQFNSRL